MTAQTPAKRTRDIPVQVPGGTQDETKAPEGSASAEIEAETRGAAENADQDEHAALRAQIRAEVHQELADQIQVASGVLQGGTPQRKPGRGDYKNTPAADIDHTKLTAPVMTRDGWLCPPPPEAKR